MDEVDVIIVGGGLAGLSTAYCLGDSGLQVLLLERGDHSGSKNVSGGRIYLEPVRNFFPSLWKEAPLERHVVRESLTLLTPDGSTSIHFRTDEFSKAPYGSFTILRSKFDRWFAGQVSSRGVFVVPKNTVDGLLLENGRIAGIRAGDQEIRSRMVVAADGALSTLAEKSGLEEKPSPKKVALGIKEVLELPREAIEERFHLKEEEGAAHLFVGDVTHGRVGGGFLYTNQESLSIGVVVHMQDAMREPLEEIHSLLDAFKERPEVAPLVRGGKLVEYSAHMIPEGGFKALPRLSREGILLAGDAAGLVINTGIALRGMDLAMVSGFLAAQAIRETAGAKDFSRAAPARYQELMEESSILRDMETFQHAPAVLNNPRIFTHYPAVVQALFSRWFTVKERGNEKLSKSLREALKGVFFNKKGLKDLFQFLKI